MNSKLSYRPTLPCAVLILSALSSSHMALSAPVPTPRPVPRAPVSPSPAVPPSTDFDPFAPKDSAPINDDISNAIEVFGRSGGISGTTVGATKDENGDEGWPPYVTLNHSLFKSVWYLWVAPSSGGYTFTCDGNFETFVEEFLAGGVVTIPNTEISSGFVQSSPSHAGSSGSYTSSRTTTRVVKSGLIQHLTRPWGYACSSTINAVEGHSYFIMVMDNDGQEDNPGGEGQFSLSWKPGPDNDNFVNATKISDAAGSIAGSNVGASHENYDPFWGSDKVPYGEPEPTQSVWYQWTAPTDADYTFHLTGDFQAAVGVMTGDFKRDMPIVAQSVDPVFPNDCFATLHAVAGTTYHVLVEEAGYTNLGQGPFTLNWMKAPVNDDFDEAQAITGRAGSVSGTNRGASREKDEVLPKFKSGDAGDTAAAKTATANASAAPAADSIGSSVWYQWTAPDTGGYTFTSEGKTPSIITVTTGDQVNALIEAPGVAARQETPYYYTSIDAVKGTVYNIQVDDYHAEQGDFKLIWTPRPRNDDFAAATPLSGESWSIPGFTAGATGEIGEPTATGSSTHRSVWYRWQAPKSEPMSITAVGNSTKPVLAIYAGNTVNDLAPIVQTNSDIGVTAQRVSFDAEAGAVYFIAVEDLNGETGRFNLNGVSSAPGQ